MTKAGAVRSPGVLRINGKSKRETCSLLPQIYLNRGNCETRDDKGLKILMFSEDRNVTKKGLGKRERRGVCVSI